MKALLMHRDRDFLTIEQMPREERYRGYGQPQLSPHERALMQDLEVDTLLRAMAGEDPFLLEVARRALLAGLSNDVDTVLYRQAILKDCLKNPAVVRQLYDLTVETIEGRKKHWWGISSNFPGSILRSSVDLMQMLMGMLRRLRDIAEARAAEFESEGFVGLFATLGKELDDEYFASVHDHLARLKFRAGVLVSASPGEGNAGANYVLRQANGKGPNWLERILGKGPPAYTFHLHPRDEAGARIVSELRDRGINLVANALAQATEHVLSFFEMLWVELGFYVGCLNLRDRLAAMGAPMCFPEAAPLGMRRLRCSELYDVSLALTTGRSVVGNAVDADHKSLVIITGANQGGKSTFLRSIGLAQLMMQCGMFVGAASFSAELCNGLFVHYKREEDATMKSGKLDEELRRMSDIADAIGPDSILLFNESFASTNEREGSEIARQIVCALLEKRIKVVFVTHLYEFAHAFYREQKEGAIFLRAERQGDSTRTFKLIEGEPLQTSYGADLYQQIFGAAANTDAAGCAARTVERGSNPSPADTGLVPSSADVSESE